MSGSKPKAPPPPPEPPPPAEAVDMKAQGDISKEARKRATGAKQTWLTRGQSLGGGTQMS